MTPEEAIGPLLRGLGWMIATVETDTGGLISHQLIRVPGSSAYVIGGVVAYANSLKTGLLGLDAEAIGRYGIVSAETALALAQAARRALGADLGLATTGIAGPPDPTRRSQKPVGLAYVAAVWPGGQAVEEHRWPSHDRQANMRASAAAALELALVVVRRQTPRPPAME